MAKKKIKTNVVTKENKIKAGLLVSDRVKLKDVRLIGSKCDQIPEATLGKKTFAIDYSTEVQVDRKSGYVIVIAKFHFKAFTDSKFAKSKVQKPVVVIEASFLLAYKIENFEGLTQEGFELFANLNGIYNAWPYWREFVQNSIARMGLPSLAIPVFRIVKPPKEKAIKQKIAKKKVTKKIVS